MSMSKVLNKRVYILQSDRLYDELFMGLGYTLVDSLDDNPDLICFTGGSDVSPQMYGEKPTLRTIYTDEERDAFEAHVFQVAVGRSIPIVGICRGAQLLCALNGGTLVQHLNGHGSGDHLATTIIGDRTFNVSSSHHQMMIPDKSGEVILSSPKLSKEYIRGSDKPLDLSVDIEAVRWPKTHSLGVQFHPEWMNKKEMANIWFKGELERLVA